MLNLTSLTRWTFNKWREKSQWMKWGRHRGSESIGHGLQTWEMILIRAFIIFNSVVRSDGAQHRMSYSPPPPLPDPLLSAACSVGLPDSRVALFFTGLAIITRDSTGHLRIQEQHRAICPCLLSAPSGGAMRGSRNNRSAAVAHPPSQCVQRKKRKKKKKASIR